MKDVDIEQAELEAIGNAMSVAKKAGICFHNGTMGPIGAAQHGYVLTGTQRMCFDCGTTFPSDEAWLETRDEVMEEWT